ncbi:hypothetical protein BDQ12DRAFT_593976 [Crucibulum laeve]|uniref:Transcription activator of gluconeogenesis ERT1 n=1 Tax=Crucibulum laeve TaxID=68775 RepID=A0A5C3MI91_9AGAR|nr:hypothetical protein BDQ12DRAFT_593976 [Crucibulum laeve]
MSAVYAVAPRPVTLAVGITAITPAYVNPAQMQNAQAGPSSSQAALKKKTVAPPPQPPPPQPNKRKRTDTPEETGSDTATQPSRKVRDGPKKKKANRACFHCQKAHLTCDDSRPCQRCIKRGIASNCTEGHRKKAKYLLDEEELEQLKRGKSSAPSESNANTSTVSPAAAAPPATSEPPAPPISSESYSQNDSLLTAAFDPAFTFGSEAANLEYSILSAILGNPSPPESATTPPPQTSQQSYSSWPSDPIDFASTSPRLDAGGSSFTSPYDESSMAIQHSSTSLSTSPSSAAHYLTYPYTQPQQSEDLVELQYPSQYSSSQNSVHPLQPRYPLDARPRSPPPTVFLHNPSSKDHTSRGLLSPPPSNGSPSSTASVPSAIADIVRPQSCGSQLQSITDRVTAPYDYTEGYHFLMKHLPTRFEKNDILRIVRALAIFRPSLIALQMPLSLDDEIFVERCFQRSLLELDKLISMSGTPTVVWRRTGEICLVAPEFCMLTEWPMEDLVGRKKYIYELFENQSVVEYWENFASHAFENTTQSVYSHCVLLKPSGAPVPATFCFSIRRDLFDLPSIVIGQWLPLL